MVALISMGYSIRRILAYNENKVKEGMAQCIGEGNYPIVVDKLSLSVKLNRFLKQLELNQNVTSNSVHISLNFAPSETGFAREKLVMIAERYMQRIGFGEQPYLVYQHLDAGHPHLHVVSVNVRSDRSRIKMYNIAKDYSINACRDIEREFKLISAAGQKGKLNAKLEPIVMGKITYGKYPFKKSIGSVLDGVLEQYAYTSLAGLNAVLRQYNVWADPGGEHSTMFKNRGLVYRILDEDGKPVGSYTKASDFHNKPTLQFLEKQYKKNELKRMPHRARIKNIIRKSLLGEPSSLDEFVQQLEKQGVHAALHGRNTGWIRAVTYVDHRTKCVFDENDLGKHFHAEMIQEIYLINSISKENGLPYSRAERKNIGNGKIRNITP